MKCLRNLSVVVTVALFATACGDQNGTVDNRDVNVQCERQSIDQFDSCMYGSFGLDQEATEQLGDLCASACSRVEAFWITHTPFTDLYFAQGVQEIAGTIRIESNDDLESLHGLENLVSAGYDVNYISNNPKLDNFDGLRALTRLHGSQTTISGNGIRSFEGLNALEEVDGHLVIEWNAQLETLRALESLERIGGSLWVENNENLPTCEVQWLVDRVEVEGDVNVSNNGADTDADCS